MLKTQLLSYESFNPGSHFYYRFFLYVTETLTIMLVCPLQIRPTVADGISGKVQPREGQNATVFGHPLRLPHVYRIGLQVL